MFKKVFCVWLLRSNQINTEHSVKQFMRGSKCTESGGFERKLIRLNICSNSTNVWFLSLSEKKSLFCFRVSIAKYSDQHLFLYTFRFPQDKVSNYEFYNF